MDINQHKYESVILYLCKRLGGEIHGKKKLAKLLYFVDFDFFEFSEGTLVTGDTYKALPMGPFPNQLDAVTQKMKSDNTLTIEKVVEREGYLATEIYQYKKEPDLTLFSAEEKKMLDRVVARYGQLTGKQLEDITHAEAPYVGTDLQSEIPYELAYYRGTDFADV